MMMADKGPTPARVTDFLLSWDRLGFRPEDITPVFQPGAAELSVRTAEEITTTADRRHNDFDDWRKSGYRICRQSC